MGLGGGTFLAFIAPYLISPPHFTGPPGGVAELPPAPSAGQHSSLVTATLLRRMLILAPRGSGLRLQWIVNLMVLN